MQFFKSDIFNDSKNCKKLVDLLQKGTTMPTIGNCLSNCYCLLHQQFHTILEIIEKLFVLLI